MVKKYKIDFRKNGETSYFQYIDVLKKNTLVYIKCINSKKIFTYYQLVILVLVRKLYK